VQKELLNGAELSDLFLEFDDKPLGSASIAQVTNHSFIFSQALFTFSVSLSLSSFNLLHFFILD
jgi:ABC1 atypical kinase-like domain